MHNDNKGYSLVELLAVIIITSFIMIPLMSAFVNNVAIYDRLEKRRSTVGIVDVITNNINNLDFIDIKNSLDDSAEHYSHIDSSTCDTTYFSVIEDQNLCTALFNITYNNYNIDDDVVIDIYIFDWNITEEEKDTGVNAIMLNEDIPQIVKDELFPPDFVFGPGGESTLAMRYFIVAQYSDEPSALVIIGGVLIDD